MLVLGWGGQVHATCWQPHFSGSVTPTTATREKQRSYAVRRSASADHLERFQNGYCFYIMVTVFASFRFWGSEFAEFRPPFLEASLIVFWSKSRPVSLGFALRSPWSSAARNRVRQKLIGHSCIQKLPKTWETSPWGTSNFINFQFFGNFPNFPNQLSDTSKLVIWNGYLWIPVDFPRCVAPLLDHCMFVGMPNGASAVHHVTCYEKWSMTALKSLVYH